MRFPNGARPGQVLASFPDYVYKRPYVWIDTPDRDRLTGSDVHGAVQYRPITRYDVVGGYLNPDGLATIAESPKEERS